MLKIHSSKNIPDDYITGEYWKALRNGDPGAFNFLLETFYKVLYDYGRRFTSDITLVEDAIQELFLDLWRRREFLGETQHVKFYLLKSIRRKIHLQCRNALVLGTLFPENWERMVLLQEAPIESDIISAETRLLMSRKLESALATLTRRQQEAIYLKFYQELDYSEVSEIMAINEQSAYNLICSAIKSLRKVL